MLVNLFACTLLGMHVTKLNNLIHISFPTFKLARCDDWNGYVFEQEKGKRFFGILELVVG